MNYGLILSEPEGDDYVGGVFSPIPDDVIQPTGQWDEWLPEPEYQNLNGVEPSACASFGTLSAVECLIRRLYNE